MESDGPYWNHFLSKLKLGEPLQYISHQAYFYKSEFYVDERVLIPRSETEILVERATQLVSRSSLDPFQIIEVGVGPGTIGLSLLQEINNKKINFLGSDISQDALDVFDINQFKLSFKIPSKHSIKTCLTDRLAGVSTNADIIVSNPPYIKKTSDRELVHRQVLQFEPEVALFLEDAHYKVWFEDFFHQVKNLIKPGGHFLMEGHENHLEDLNELGQVVFGKSGKIINDFTNRNRFIEFTF